MDKSAIESAIAKAKELITSLESFDGTPAQHLDILKRVDKVRGAIEEPYDIGTRWLENMSVSAAVNVLVRLGVYEHIPTDGASISAADLASACGADVSIITRAMRLAVNNGIFAEAGPDTYKHNQISPAFGPAALGGFVGVCNDLMKSWTVVPEYVKEHKPEDLYDVKKTPFAYANGHEGKTYYEVLELDPARRLLWNTTLQTMDKNFPIMGMFPFKDLEPLAKDGSDRPVLVDIGGGKGQVLMTVRENCGDFLDGKMILQDLPIVINSLKAEDLPGVKPMVHDIFTPQPVKNAHVYYMRRLLHDFYDPDVIQILKGTASAMGPDSRLVISDMLVPEMTEVGGPMTLYWLDFSLLSIGGKERSRSDFDKVLAEAGLELVKLYKSEGSDIVTLETRLKQTA